MSDRERSCSVSKKTMITEHFRVRKRREMLLAQVCVVCGVLLAAWCLSALLTKTGEWMGMRMVMGMRLVMEMRMVMRMVTGMRMVMRMRLVMGIAGILRSHPPPLM